MRLEVLFKPYLTRAAVTATCALFTEVVAAGVLGAADADAG
jgi:hypothetical protein